jgi:hypothetical protein
MSTRLLVCEAETGTETQEHLLVWLVQRNHGSIEFLGELLYQREDDRPATFFKNCSLDFPSITELLLLVLAKGDLQQQPATQKECEDEGSKQKERDQSHTLYRTTQTSIMKIVSCHVESETLILNHMIRLGKSTFVVL